MPFVVIIVVTTSSIVRNQSMIDVSYLSGGHDSSFSSTVKSPLFVIFSTRSSFEVKCSKRVSICAHPMSTFLNFWNNEPCRGFDIKSASIFSVGQYLTFIFPCLILSVLQKYLMARFLEFAVHDSFPFKSILISDSLSFASVMVTSYPCASINNSKNIGFGKYSLVPRWPLPLRVSREQAGLNTKKESQMPSGRRKKKSRTQGIIKTAKNVLSPMRLFEGKMKDVVDKS